MQLTILVAVLAALVSAERISEAPVTAAPERLVVALCGMGMVWWFAWVLARMTARALERHGAVRRSVLKRFGRLRTLHAALWLAVCFGILFGLDWASLVHVHWNLGRIFLADDLLVIAPVLVPQVLSWGAFYDVDCALRSSSASAVANSRAQPSRAAYVLLHVRHYFGLLLVPLLVVLAVHDATELLAPQLVADRQAWIVFVVALGGLAVGFPLLLRYVWDTRPLESGTLRKRLEQMQDDLNVGTRHILVWRTDRRIHNAAVAGITPGLRYVFLSDGLLARMPDDQILAVYAHELGHVQYRHPQLRLFALVAPVAVWQAIVCILPATGISPTALPAGLQTVIQSPALPLIFMGLYCLTVFAWYSRRMELQADLCACGLDRATTLDSDERIRQAAVFVAALRSLAVMNDDPDGGGGLMHPSLLRRIGFIRHMVHDPRAATTFVRTMRLFAFLLVGLVAASIAVIAATLIAAQ